MIPSLLLALAMMLAVLLVPVAILQGWAWWLRKRTSVPTSVVRRAHHLSLAWLVLMVVTPVGGAVYATLGSDVALVDPSQKARVLAEAISGAMNVTAALELLVLTGIVFYVLYATWRWHWSVGKTTIPRDPPYR